MSEVEIEMAAPSGLFDWLGILSWVLPLILISGFFLIIFRQAQSSGNQAISFGKSRARMFTGEKPTITFDDVAGVEEAKQELSEIVEFLKEPQKFIALGARIPKGCHPDGRSGHGQNPDGQGSIGRGWRPLLFHLWLRVRRDVCGRRGQPCAGPL